LLDQEELGPGEKLSAFSFCFESGSGFFFLRERTGTAMARGGEVEDVELGTRQRREREQVHGEMLRDELASSASVSVSALERLSSSETRPGNGTANDTRRVFGIISSDV
jgi:hypothetical protein